MYGLHQKHCWELKLHQQATKQTEEEEINDPEYNHTWVLKTFRPVLKSILCHLEYEIFWRWQCYLLFPVVCITHP